MRGGAERQREREEAEDILPFMTWPQKSHRITSTTSRLFVSSSRHLKGPSGFKRVGGRAGQTSLFKWKWQGSRRARGTGNTATAVTTLENKVGHTEYVPDPIPKVLQIFCHFILPSTCEVGIIPAILHTKEGIEVSRC